MPIGTGRLPWIAIPAFLTAGCGVGGGGGAAAPITTDAPPEVLLCRARVDDPHRFAEIALRSVRNLGTARISDRTGPETHARLHPDGVRVVFARERFFEDPDSRELFVATLDNSAQEARLTQNTVRDDDPVWSADGNDILFASERDGVAGLWIADATGNAAQPFLPVPTGFADGEPDWHAGTNRVVWSRRDLIGRHSLWIANGSGFGASPLTDGGATFGPGSGDRDPAFSPDGSTIVFVRRSSDDRASLCLCDVQSGAVTVRLAADGDVALPRFTPAMDRLFFGLAEPNEGRATLRLAELPVIGGEPTLVWPDERWQLRGIEFVPAVPAGAAAGAPQVLDVRSAQVRIDFASATFGVPFQLEADDDNEYYLRTDLAGGRQVAGLTCRFDLPVVDPEDALELRVTAIVRASRVDGESLFRIALDNPVDSRSDTAVEFHPDSTAEQTLQVRTSSLRHVTRQKRFSVTLIADLDPGDRADFWIDLVEVVLMPRMR